MILFCLGNQYDGTYGHFEFSVCMKPVDIYMIYLWLDCGKDAITYYILSTCPQKNVGRNSS